MIDKLLEPISKDIEQELQSRLLQFGSQTDNPYYRYLKLIVDHLQGTQAQLEVGFSIILNWGVFGNLSQETKAIEGLDKVPKTNLEESKELLQDLLNYTITNNFFDFLLELMLCQHDLLPENDFCLRLPTQNAIGCCLGAMAEAKHPLMRSRLSQSLGRLIQQPLGVHGLIHSLLSKDDTQTLEKLHQIGRICSVPPKDVAPKVYFANILTQMGHLFHSKDKLDILAVSHVFSVFSNHQPKRIHFFLSKSLANLVSIQECLFENKERDFEEQSISHSLDLLENILLGCSGNANLFDFLKPYFTPLYLVWQTAAHDEAYFKDRLFEVIKCMLQLSTEEETVACIAEMVSKASQLSQVKMVFKVSGDLSITKSDESHFKPMILCHFVEKLSQDICGGIFVKLLQEYTIYSQEDEHLAAHYGTLVLVFLESFGDAVLKNTLQILQFVKLQLLGKDPEVLMLGMSLLNTLLDGEPLPEEPLSEIKIILQNLDYLGDPQLSDLIRTIKVKLVQLNVPKSESQSASLKRFTEALNDLKDELLPVRAHGLTALKNMLLEKDPVAEENVDGIISIFLELIGDEDSFIYLNAVKGLNALGEAYPQHILAKMASRYKDETNDLDYRLRLGEAFLQIIQRAGPTLSVHASIVAENIFLVLLSKQTEIQSSALSLLSALAQENLHLFVPFMYQILDYIHSCLQLEKRPEIKRGISIDNRMSCRALPYFQQHSCQYQATCSKRCAQVSQNHCHLYLQN
ncbi:hypothetical protein EDD86DRAFT_143613 [Gorgonomyces haynaldii]|nr:hypothetical protein EDD86DRAFT_143613 [Gorgonomyces haynaldii]